MILGAGFSKAVHKGYPVLGELAKLVLPHLNDAAAPTVIPMIEELRQQVSAELGANQEKSGLASTNFETWLSRLGVDQPHLSLTENLARRALFASAANAIRTVLIEAEQASEVDACSRSTRDWLPELLWLLHVRGSTLITMNYDTIIERTATSVLWPLRIDAGDLVPPGMLLASDLFGELPPTVPSPRATFRVLNSNEEIPRPLPVTFRLIKLHGSLDWFAARGDLTGATLMRWEPHDTQRRSSPSGREPFIVPPDANKSAYFDNPPMRQMWADARAALGSAAEVTLVGYSLPVTDTTFSGLLADTLVHNQALVRVVDRRPDPVVERLRTLGVTPGRITKVDGDEATKTWTKEAVDRQAYRAAKKLAEQRYVDRAGDAVWSATVVVRPTREGLYGGGWAPPVASTAIQDGALILKLKGPDERNVPSQRPLGDFLPPPGVDRLEVDLDGIRRPIIDFELGEPGPYAVAGVLRLVPVGR